MEKESVVLEDRDGVVHGVDSETTLLFELTVLGVLAILLTDRKDLAGGEKVVATKGIVRALRADSRIGLGTEVKVG